MAVSAQLIVSLKSSALCCTCFRDLHASLPLTSQTIRSRAHERLVTGHGELLQEREQPRQRCFHCSLYKKLNSIWK